MARQAEVRLYIILGFVLVGIGVLVWGQVTGNFKILGDAVITSSGNTPVSVSITPVTSPTATTTTSAPTATSNSNQIYIEKFASSQYLDSANTTADWNIEANNVRLLAAETEGKVQSLTVSQISGSQVSLELSVTEDIPFGGAIYYSVSADGGTTWRTVLPYQVAIFDNPKGDWRWRAILTRDSANRSPVLSELTLNFKISQ